jgi:hypothetical protein
VLIFTPSAAIQLPTDLTTTRAVSMIVMVAPIGVLLFHCWFDSRRRLMFQARRKIFKTSQ